MQGHGHLLGRQEVVAHRHRQREVQHQHGGRSHLLLGALDLEVLGLQLHGHAAAGAGQGVADGPADVEVEGVAELVGLGVGLALVAHPLPVDGVAAELVRVELGEQVPQRTEADLADGSGGEVEAAIVVLDQTGLLQHASHLGHALEALGRVVSQQPADGLGVGLGEGAGAGRAPQQVLELVDVPQFGQHVGCVAEVERVRAAELVAPVPAEIRELVAEVSGQLVHLPVEVHVGQQLVGQLLELVALGGGHRVHQGLGCRHAAGHDLQELVEGLGVLTEEVAVALHEPLEVGLLASGPLGQHGVELGQHVLEPLHLLRRRALGGVVDCAGHAVQELLHELLAQLLGQLGELLAGLVALEVVVVEGLELAGQVGGQHVELEVLGGRGLGGEVGPALVAFGPGPGRGRVQLVQRPALGADHIAQGLGDVVVHAAEVVILQQLAATLPQPLEHVAQTLDPAARTVLEPVGHETAQRAGEIAVVEQVVGQLVEDRVGV